MKGKVTRKIRPVPPLEREEQEALMAWARCMEGRCPELRLLHHIPNGGSRNRVEAVHLKRQGVKAGVPDLCLPVARGGYHGLYIEMKRKGGRLSEEQKAWIAALREQGYAAVVCYGAADAEKRLRQYLDGDGTCAEKAFRPAYVTLSHYPDGAASEKEERHDGKGSKAGVSGEDPGGDPASVKRRGAV